jgi:hypothetical protein
MITNYGPDHVTAEYFYCAGRTASFFSALGRQAGDGNFQLYTGGDWRILNEWHLEDPKITQLFAFWLQRGGKKKHRFTHLHLSPTYAVLAFLLGTLTVGHLINAQEGPEYIDIPFVDVGLENHRVTVRVMNNASKDVMAADDQGRQL